MKKILLCFGFIFILFALISCKRDINSATRQTYPGWVNYSNENTQFGTTVAVDAHGNVWVGTESENGVFKFNGQNWTEYVVVNGYYVDFVGSLVGDTLGNMWMTADCGLAEYTDTGWIAPYDTTNSKINFFAISHIALDHQGNLWGCGGGNYLIEFNGISWNTYYYSVGGTCIAIDWHGNKWLGTDGSGVNKFDGYNWTNYNSENSGIVSNSYRKYCLWI